MQLAVAEAETLLRSSRAFVFDAVNDLWEATERGDEITEQQRMVAHLACSSAAATSVRVVDTVCAAAGTRANFESCPLERCQRDVRVVPQHIMVSSRWIEAAGRSLLGAAANAPLG